VQLQGAIRREGWLPLQGLQRGRCMLQVAPFGAYRRVQAPRYHFSTCNQHALTAMDGGNADFAGAKICLNDAFFYLKGG